jgi:hypothetical protein
MHNSEDYYSQPGAFQGLAGEKEQELDAAGNEKVQEAFNIFQGTGVGDLTGGGGEPPCKHVDSACFSWSACLMLHAVARSATIKPWVTTALCSISLT